MHRKPIRVVHFISNLAAGGAERAMSRLLGSLDSGVYSNSVCSLKGRDTVAVDLEKSGVSVCSLKELLMGPSRYGSDLLCGWMYHGNLVALVFACLLRRSSPVIWNIRQCLHDRSMDGRLTRWLINAGAWLSKSSRVKAILYNSEAARQQHEAIGYATHKSVLMRNGFDDGYFSPDNPAPQDLADLKGKRLIGIAGRYHKVKGHRDFIQAISLFRRSRVIPGAEEVRFVFIGRGLDSGNQELLDLLESHAVTDAVLLGERQDIQNILPSLDVLTSASLSEGLPNVVAEAMLSAVPCVVTDVGDSRYLVGEYGEVVAVGSPAELAAAWERIFSHSAEERAATGEHARRRIRKELSLDKQRLIFIDVISRALVK